MCMAKIGFNFVLFIVDTFECVKCQNPNTKLDNKDSANNDNKNVLINKS